MGQDLLDRMINHPEEDGESRGESWKWLAYGPDFDEDDMDEEGMIDEMDDLDEMDEMDEEECVKSPRQTQ